jgi:hypothetical protein
VALKVQNVVLAGLGIMRAVEVELKLSRGGLVGRHYITARGFVVGWC